MTTRAETEAEKMRRVPGIEFTDTPTGRMAKPVGTGIRVWQMIQSMQFFCWDRAEYFRTYDWITDAQLDAALQYYRLYPDEIDARIAREHEYTPEQVYEMYPFMRPHRD